MPLRSLVLTCFLLCSTAVLYGQTVNRTELPSGLTIIHVDRRHTHTAELLVLIDAGQSREGSLQGSAVSRVLQGLIREAAQRRSDEIARVGGRLALTSEAITAANFTGFTGYALTTTDQTVPEALGLMAAIISQPPLDQQSIDRQKLALARQQAVAGSDPSTIIAREVANNVYRQHPARLPVHGIAALRDQLTVEQVLTFHQQQYTAANTTVIVVGNIGHDEVRKLVADRFSVLPAGFRAHPPSIVEPLQFAERNAVVAASVMNERHAYAWRTWPLSYSRDHAALALIQRILQYELGEALAQVRDGRSIASAVRVNNRAPLTYPGYFLVSFEPDENAPTDAWIVVQKVMDRLRKEGPSESALLRAKGWWRREYVRQQATVAGIARELARWETAVGDPSFGHNFAARIEAITTEDIKRVATSLLHPKGPNRSKVVISDKIVANNGDGDRQALEDVSPLPNSFPSGLRLVTRYMPIGLAHIRATIGGGRSREADNQAGWTNILTGLLQEGSASRAGADLRKVLDDNNIELSVRNTAHSVELHLVAFPNDVNKALEVLVDILEDPALPQNALERQIQQQLGQLGTAAIPAWDRLLATTLRDVLLPDHYASKPVLGRRETLEELNRESILEFHRGLVVSGNVVISVYGEFDQASIKQDLEEKLEADPVLTDGVLLSPTGSPWSEESPVALTNLTSESGTSAMALAWRAPSLGQLVSDGAAMDVLSAILAGDGGRGGRIGRALEAAGINPGEDLVVDTESYAGRGLWTVRARVSDGQLQTLRETVTNEVAQLVQALRQGPEVAGNGLDAVEVAGAQALCANARSLANEDQDAVSLDHARTLLRSESLEHRLAYRKRIDGVTWADLLRVAETYLDREPIIVQLAPPGKAGKPAKPEEGAENEGTNAGNGASTVVPPPEQPHNE